MNKKYKIIWRNSQHNILQIDFLAEMSWADLLTAIREALDIVNASSHEVVLFINSPQYEIESVSMGTISKELFGKLPRTPGKLKRVIVLPTPSQRFMLEVGIEVVAGIFYGRKFVQVVGNLEEAEKRLRETL